MTQTMAQSDLSVIIITLNEAHNIERALQSVTFADEIIVVDAGSTDDTVAICQAFGARVIQTSDWPGFGRQKQRALEQAQRTWVLSIDADEVVTPDLAAAIKQACQSKTEQGFFVTMENMYCGRVMRHGNWKGGKKLRLFRRSAGCFSDVPVHEAVIVAGPTGTLNGKLRHFTHPTLDAALSKLNRYTTVAAESRVQRGKTTSLSRALTHGLWAFIKGYILRAGFLDGKEGFLLAILNAEASFYTYAKMLYLPTSDAADGTTQPTKIATR